MSKKKEKPPWSLITNNNRGIYFGRIKERLPDGSLFLSEMRNVFYYTANGDKGTFSLATTGPGPGSKIGPIVVDVTLRNVSADMPISDAATVALDKAGWGTRC